MQYASHGVAPFAHQKMKLRAFLDGLPRGGIAEFAGEVGITPIYLSQLAAELKDRVPSPELCVLIERATSRKVMRWDLRPKDWHLIWPELIGSEGAPSIPELPPAAPEGAQLAKAV